MRRYESVWVIHGDLPDEEVKSALDKFSRIISTHGGMLVGMEEWGRRKLGYKIQGTLRGYYVLADFAGLATTVKELERNFRIDDRIIRYQTVVKSKKVNLEALQAEMAVRAQAATPAPEPEAAPLKEAAAPAPEASLSEAAPLEEATSPAKED